MNTVLESLKGLSAYPIPFRTLLSAFASRGFSIEAQLNEDIAGSPQYRLLKADILMWLSMAPDISQGGQSYSFSDLQRKEMRVKAQAIYDELEPESRTVPKYGYKGSSL